ncbi:hypothetical protein [Flavobacterium tegetincola]|uniref:hypothetical protein n=1 Tax=Flavobacterium tegetincola TaxID=150172 RepID=UPI00047D90D2|nr:hypothetical protein [Flavobacterium tegetincola]
MLKTLSLPIKIALFSFVIGTLLFISQFIYHNQFDLLVFGLFFVLLAVLVNFITLLYLIRKAFKAPSTNPKTTEEILTVLANIPIAALYIFIIFN